MEGFFFFFLLVGRRFEFLYNLWVTLVVADLCDPIKALLPFNISCYTRLI